METQAASDLTTLDDPGFLAERARVRDALADGTSAELAACMAALNDEFDRRASAAWRAGTA
jgi:hypothetical protein